MKLLLYILFETYIYILAALESAYIVSAHFRSLYHWTMLAIGFWVKLPIDVKKNLFSVFKNFGHVFYVFNVFLNFQTFFYFKKNVDKVQSGKQIDKKHFQNNSNKIDLWFFCCMSNDQ